MFSFFKKKPKMPTVSDKVWISEQAKWKGFIADIQLLLEQKTESYTVSNDSSVLDSTIFGQKPKVCIFYYFENTLEELENSLGRYNLPLVTLERSSSSSSIVAIPAIELEHSMRLQNSLKDYLNKNHCTLIFAEHYPLLSKEQPVLERIASLSDTDLKVCFYMSLDEPLMKKFGSDRIIELMKKMGMQEDEAIEHSMISSALSNAQKKLDAKVQTDAKSSSAEEWFKRNVKD